MTTTTECEVCHGQGTVEAPQLSEPLAVYAIYRPSTRKVKTVRGVRRRGPGLVRAVGHVAVLRRVKP
jgi:transcription elongation factor Elf1